MKTGHGFLVYTPKYGDLAPGRVGNGTLEYEVPLSDGGWRRAALAAENLDGKVVRVKDAARPGVLVLRMPSSYVYLTGEISLKAAVGDDGAVVVSFSDNNGLDWKEVARLTAAGTKRLDVSPLVLCRYDCRLKFELHGRGTGLEALPGDREPLPPTPSPKRRGGAGISAPPLRYGEGVGGRGSGGRFAVGPPEGTVTVEASSSLDHKGKQAVYTDFHPQQSGFEKNLFIGASGKGSITFPVATPGDMVRLRFGAHYRARDARDGLDYLLSFDGGKNWKKVARAAGPTVGDCKYVTCADVPPRTRTALVRFAGTSRNATGLLNFRIDADYREPHGGFRPVKVTYTWEENGKEKRHVRVARKPHETYTITCAAKPLMRSVALELAE